MGISFFETFFVSHEKLWFLYLRGGIPYTRWNESRTSIEMRNFQKVVVEDTVFLLLYISQLFL